MKFRVPGIFRRDHDFKKSYAQNGEDIIICNILEWLHVQNPTYLDIGTFHPRILSNTYLLYLKGHRGVCIEPNTFLLQEIKRVRSRDLCLNVGISDHSGKATFYMMRNRTLSTLDREQALYFQSKGTSEIEREIEIDIVTLAAIVDQHFQGKAPDFISLDIEGMDLRVLEAFDFNKYRPLVLCLETKDASENKNEALIGYMKKQGYFICADTYINSIFVDQNTWDNRLHK